MRRGRAGRSDVGLTWLTPAWEMSWSWWYIRLGGVGWLRTPSPGREPERREEERRGLRRKRTRTRTRPMEGGGGGGGVPTGCSTVQSVLWSMDLCSLWHSHVNRETRRTAGQCNNASPSWPPLLTPSSMPSNTWPYAPSALCTLAPRLHVAANTSPQRGCDRSRR